MKYTFLLVSIIALFISAAQTSPEPNNHRAGASYSDGTAMAVPVFGALDTYQVCSYMAMQLQGKTFLLVLVNTHCTH
jgi:hypothetical protein